MNKLLCSFICLLLFSHLPFCYGQGIVNVSPLTGTANVGIPLYNITSGSVSVPIQVLYNATGIKPKDVEGTAGIGWQLEAGGQISRQVRGLPDDIKKDNAGNTLNGWMYNTNQSAVNSFTIANNGSTCSYETTDINYITTNFGNNYDTEPDMFYINAPGLSCQMVYDQTAGKFRTIPYQDLVIAYTTNPTTGLITSFTITNNLGNKYYFSAPELVTQTTDLIHNASGVVNYFKTEYSQYVNGVNFDDSWNLISITDLTGQGVVLTDTVSAATYNTNIVNLYLGGSTTSSLQYNIHQKVYPQVMTKIQIINDDEIANTELSFQWGVGPSTYAPIILSISGRGDTVSFNYNHAIYSGDATNYQRAFLGSVTGRGCGTPLNFAFSYAGQTVSHGIYNTVLSDSVSKKFDYWGYNSAVKDSIPAVYVNPSTSGYQRYAVAASATPGSAYLYTLGMSYSRPDTVGIMAGTLDTVSYVNGGMTTMTYESNDYLDVPSNTVVKGGGIRIKQIVDYDGINTANNMVRNYSYTNPSTGTSSGKPIALPAYAFTIPYTGGGSGQPLWNSSTAISDQDLSTEDHTIMYGYVRQSAANAGSTLSQYYLPATNWDASAVPGCNGCTTVDWLPTENYVGRTNCAATYGQVKNDTYSYPFVYNTNYDFERGLLQKVTNFNSATPAVEVSETDYSYQRSYGTATAISALQFDYNQGTTGVLGYSKYNVYTTTSELTSQVVNKVFDSPTLSSAQQSTVNYAYTSAYHKLLTQQTTTNSDNSVLITNINYIKDYSASSGTNPNVTAIYNLQQENVNVPVETWTQVQRSGTTYTTGASLTYFSLATGTGNTTNFYLPSQQFKFFSADGDSGFAPFTISGQTATKYSGYPALPAANFTQYDYNGGLQTMDDGHHHQQSSIIDYYAQRPVITATNAASTELAFEDFDSFMVTPFINMALSGIPTFVPGHTGNGATFLTTQTLASSSAISKNANAKKYVFSMWINSGTAASYISIKLTPTTGSPLTYTETFSATGSNWQYFEWRVPVTAMTATFTVTVTTHVTIAIDDIAFYPENTEITTNSYDPVTHFQTSTTNTNGISTYYANDRWGRIVYVYDRYKNILKKDSYVTPAQVQNFGNGALSASVPVGGHFDTNTPVTLLTTSGAGGCYTSNTTFTWTYGDSSAPVIKNNAGSPPSHIYTHAGSYTATLTINSPVFGKFQSSTLITIVSGPNTNLSYNNYATSMGNVKSVDFYQGATLIYSFTPAQLPAAQVLKGTYNIQVVMAVPNQQYNPATGVGWESIYISGDHSAVGCAAYGSSLSMTVNASSCDNLNIGVYITNQCN